MFLINLIELLGMCRLDAASSFGEGKKTLESKSYDIAVLDIMGVKGMELLKIANNQNIPALVLTGHALSEENLKESAEEGASFYAPKEEIHNISLYIDT